MKLFRVTLSRCWSQSSSIWRTTRRVWGKNIWKDSSLKSCLGHVPIWDLNMRYNWSRMANTGAKIPTAHGTEWLENYSEGYVKVHQLSVLASIENAEFCSGLVFWAHIDGSTLFCTLPWAYQFSQTLKDPSYGMFWLCDEKVSTENRDTSMVYPNFRTRTMGGVSLGLYLVCGKFDVIHETESNAKSLIYLVLDILNILTERKNVIGNWLMHTFF